MTDDREQLEALLADYVDGNLSDAALRDVEAYLDRNPDVRKVVERIMADSDALKMQPRLASPMDFSEEYRGQIERDLLLGDVSTSMPRRRLLGAPLAAVAAMLVIGLGVAGGAYWLLIKRPPPFIDVALNTEPPEAAPTEGAQPRLNRVSSSRAVPPVQDESASAEASGAKAEEGPADAVTMAEPPKVDDAPDRRSAGKDNTIASSGEPNFGAGVTPSVPSVAPVAPAITMAAPPLVAAPPEDLVRVVEGELDPRRRSVMLVIDAPTPSAADAAEQQVASADLLQQGGGLANSQMQRRDVESMVIPGIGDTRSNVGPSAKAGAILDADVTHRAVYYFARGLSDESVDAYASRLQQLPGAKVERFETTPTETDRALAKELVEQQKPGDSAQPTPAEAAASVPTTAPSGESSPVPATTAPATQPARALSVGDQLIITLTDPDAFNLRTRHEVTIGPAGTIDLPSLAALPASGQTADALRQAIVDAYTSAKLMREPRVSVQLVGEMPVSDSAQPAQTAARQSAGRGPIEPAVDQIGQLSGTFGDAPTEPTLDLFVIIRAPHSATTRPATAPTND